MKYLFMIGVVSLVMLVGNTVKAEKESISIVKITRCADKIETRKFIGYGPTFYSCVTGTGAMIDNSHLLTNDHVAYGKDESNVELSFDLGGTKINLTSVYEDEENDLSVLSFDSKDFKDCIKSISIADKNMAINDVVTVKGFPGGLYSETIGKVKEMFIPNSHVLTNPVFSGNSGSPVLNKDNQLVAVIHASLMPNDKGVAVDLSHVKDAVAHIKN